MMESSMPAPHPNPPPQAGEGANERCANLSFLLTDEAATGAFAARLAGALKAGMVIYLRGDLGTGKTTLVRALLRARGVAGRVKSPTYTLLEQYLAGGLHFCHFDLYRFRDESEWEAAGFRDEFDGRNVCLVEWPEKAQGLVPRADMDVSFEILPAGRKLTVCANTATARECLRSLQS
jgi:tRNA threonylcarbamoyladenosine biosynthesis protein TsaE